MDRTEIGVMAHNEVTNLPRLLVRLLTEPGDHLVRVISSGSTDGTDEIVRQLAAIHPRLSLVVEPKRRGKARAINRFLTTLSANTNRCVIISGDVLPRPGALARLLTPLNDVDVQMTGARPCPTNPTRRLVDRIVHLQWALHDRIARVRPKLGEMVAFRPPVDPIDPDTAVDEAAIEAQLTAHHGRLVYVPEAEVLNRGPRTWRDLLAQRERIWVGHLRLQRRTGYRVSTYRLQDLVVPAAQLLMQQPRRLPEMILGATIELIARVRGTIRHRVLGELPSVWPVLTSAKIQ
jgi:cellulose synthase/poly-beta-1,6-N-acetylglucosamine synthase-like glycosyltransferase